MKTVFQTDNEGYFVGVTQADPDPLTPGNFLIPRGCVTQQPPAAAANQIARWSNGAWEIVPDFRGRAYWLPSGERHEITERGIALPPEALDEPPVLPPAIPTRVTMRQARLALLGAGLLQSVDAAVAAMPGVGGDAARIEWEYALSVERGSPLVAGLSASLGLTDAQLDALFTTAAGL